jgi:hypothetical protein
VSRALQLLANFVESRDLESRDLESRDLESRNLESRNKEEIGGTVKRKANR